ncbi:MAG: hypothetical protein OXR66_07090 [Candidatus Woesearchaeota archaeon]|nr:hypothetical protein [Candidatus Woesearchaeota archaeon]
MYQEMLEQLGLTHNEAKVYEALLTLGATKANNIALEAKIQRRNVYDTIKTLKEKGLCSETKEKGISHFTAIHPQRLGDMLREKTDLLEQAMPSMTAKFGAQAPDEQTLVLKGIEAIKTFYLDMIREGEDLLVLGGRGNWLDPRLQYFLPKMERERIAKGISYKHIFYHDLKDPKHPNHRITKILKGNKYRFLPKGFTSTCSIEIYGNKVASMYWGEEPLVVVVMSKQIAEGYRKYFEFMWQHCEKGNA